MSRPDPEWSRRRHEAMIRAAEKSRLEAAHRRLMGSFEPPGDGVVARPPPLTTHREDARPMADETLHPKKARRYRELEMLDQWMTAHGITDRNLRGRIVGIDVYLSRHDDREARLFTLNQLEQLFLFGGRRDEWAVTGLRAIALWRLYQQSLD